MSLDSRARSAEISQAVNVPTARRLPGRLAPFAALALMLMPSALIAFPSTPLDFTETEGPYGGQFYKNAVTQGTMHWNNGAVGTIIANIIGSSITLSRTDTTGASAGLSASYSGTVAANGNASGTVTWTWPGHLGFPTSGTWNAKIPTDKHLGAPCCGIGGQPSDGGMASAQGGAAGAASAGASASNFSARGATKGQLLSDANPRLVQRSGNRGGSVEGGTGSNFQTETDYSTTGPNALSFARYYNGLVTSSTFASEMGVQWRHNYDRYLNAVSSSLVTIERADGRQLNFNLVGGVWKPDTDIDMTLTNSGLVWTLTGHDDSVETYQQVMIGSLVTSEALLVSIKARNGYTQTLAYNGSNQLVTVTDSYGRQLAFTYTGGLLTQVTTPESLVLTYGYDSSGVNPGVLDRLVSVGYNTTPSSSVSYQYTNASYPFLLTSITDENGNPYLSWTYDAVGRVITSQLAGGAGLSTISYNDSAGTRTVTNALGQQVTYTYTQVQGVPKLSHLARTATATVPAASENITFDGNGYANAFQDWNGNISSYTNNAHGDATTITEPSRTTTITYDPTFVHLPKTIVTLTCTPKTAQSRV